MGFGKDAPVVITFVDQDNKLHNQRVLCNRRSHYNSIGLTHSASKNSLHHYPQTLNLAQFNSLQRLSKQKYIPFSYANLSMRVFQNYRDSTWAYMENHYTALMLHKILIFSNDKRIFGN